MPKKTLSTLLLYLSVLLTGCAVDPVMLLNNDVTADGLFKNAVSNMKRGDYKAAITGFERFQAKYPADSRTIDAEINSIYSYYKYDEFTSALEASNRFVAEHRDHPRLDYVYYIRGLVHYNQGQDALSDLFPQNMSYRDSEALKKAFIYFAELIKYFPKSKYVADSLARMKFLRNKIAEHELNVAKFYFVRKAYIASINRAKGIIENYQQTKSVMAALQILQDSYRALGLTKLANRYKQIIAVNQKKSVSIPTEKLN